MINQLNTTFTPGLPTYVDRYNFTVSDAFGRRIQTAIGNQAIIVIADKANANYTVRQKLALSVLANPAQYVTTFAFAVMSNQGFNDSSSDAGLQAEIMNRWNDIAGV